MSRVSVVIPTFNRADLVRDAVESARNACSGGVEIVVVDDASVDDTPEICAAIKGIQYVRHAENRGLAAARNTGLHHTVGEYVAFLDDDDELLPGALDLGVIALDARRAAAFFYGQVLVKGPDGTVTKDPFPGRSPEGDIFWECIAGFGPCPLAALVRRTPLFEVGGFNPDLRHFEDLDLWTRLSERFEVAASMQVVGIYREARPASGQLSSRTSLRAGLGMQVQQTWLKLPRALAASVDQRAGARARFRNKTSDLLLFAAGAALEDGLKAQARANVLTAIRLHPRRALRPLTLGLLLKSLV